MPHPSPAISVKRSPNSLGRSSSARGATIFTSVLPALWSLALLLGALSACGGDESNVGPSGQGDSASSPDVVLRTEVDAGRTEGRVELPSEVSEPLAETVDVPDSPDEIEPAPELQEVVETLDVETSESVEGSEVIEVFETAETEVDEVDEVDEETVAPTQIGLLRCEDEDGTACQPMLTGSQVSGLLWFSVQVTGSDEGIARFRFSADELEFGLLDYGATPLVASYDSTAREDGSVLIRVVAESADGPPVAIVNQLFVINNCNSDNDAWGSVLCGGDDCDDHDPLTGACGCGETCQSGTCVFTACDGKVCGDNGCGGLCGSCDESLDPCTANACLNGECVHGHSEGVCDDGDPCTVNDNCSQGVCAGEADPACQCSVDEDCIVYEDGDLCNGSTHCVAQACVVDPATVVVCDVDALEPGVCEQARCEPTTGDCLTVPRLDGTPCDDADACSDADVCVAGLCVGKPVTCDDDDPCTDAGCDPLDGCVFTNNDADCDDGDACTEEDQCDEGVCLGAEVPGCECGHDEDCLVFEDEDHCNGKLVCVGGSCLTDPDTVVLCPRDTACVSYACALETGACVATTRPDGASCSDGDACSEGDHCLAGSCKAGEPLVCDDSELCTDEACDPETGCVVSYNDNPCDDGNACTVDDLCVGGSCRGINDPSCLCDEVADCAPYEDGDPCNGILACVEHRCVVDPTTIVSCPPADPMGCVNSYCAVDTGACVTPPLPDGKPCDDADACTPVSVCEQGLCVSSGVLDCDDGNPCTDDSCDAEHGCLTSAIDVACDDKDPCTEGDHCVDTVCQPGASNICGTSCQAGLSLACGSAHAWTTLGAGAEEAVGVYGCDDAPPMPGPETTFRFTAPYDLHLSLTLDTEAPESAVFLLDDLGEGCDAENCRVFGEQTLSADIQAGASVFFVVDDALAGGAYELAVDCVPEQEQNCQDGVDEDQDGQTDCADVRDCLGTPACPETSCAPAWTLACGDVDTGWNYGPGSTDAIESYACNGWLYPGPELTYRFTSPITGPVSVSLTNEGAALDVMILEADELGACRPENCLAFGYSTATFDALAGVTYHIVVDGYVGSESSFQVALTCPETVETLCADGLDDDQDGATDCEDEDCVLTEACAPAECVPARNLRCGRAESGTTGAFGSSQAVSGYGCAPDAFFDGREYAYRFVADFDGLAQVSLSNTEAGVGLFYVPADPTGACLPGANCQIGAEAASEGELVLEFNVTAGETGFLVIDAPSAVPGGYTIDVTCKPEHELSCEDGLDEDQDGAADCLDSDCYPGPSCPACAPVSAIACGQTLTGSNDGPGSTDLMAAYPCTQYSFPAPEIAYSFTAEQDEHVTFLLWDEEVDVDVFVLGPGEACNPAVCVAYGHRSAGFEALAGETYQVVVDGYSSPDTVGAFLLRAFCGETPCRYNSDCHDEDPCTRDVCDVGECVFEALEDCCLLDLDCDDGDPCTDDACSLGDEENACVFEARDACCVDAADCDDLNPCTTDACPVPGEGCVWSPVPDCCLSNDDCDDGDAGTLDRCSSDGCSSQPLACEADSDCDDGDACSLGACVEGACLYRVAEASDCCSPDLLVEDFEEAGELSLELINSHETVAWHVSSKRAHSGSSALRYGDPGNEAYDADVPTVGRALSERLTLPVSSAVTLNFALWIEIEDLLTYDTLDLYLHRGEVSNEEARVLLWDKSAVLDSMSAWTVQQLDMSPYAGETVRLEFRFETVDATINDGGGVFLDDLRLVTDCAPKDCSVDVPCAVNETCAAEACVEGQCWQGGPLEACCRFEQDCDDGDLCTLDRCEERVCDFEPIEGCCTADPDCDDGEACTTDSCKEDNSCEHTWLQDCAVTLPYHEDFEDAATVAEAGWSIEDATGAGDVSNWRIGEGNHDESTLGIEFYYSPTLQNYDNRAVSPPIDTQGADEVVVSWIHAFDAFSGSDSETLCRLEVSIDDGATWTSVWSRRFFDRDAREAISVSDPLLAGQGSLRLAFALAGADSYQMDAWTIEDLRVEAGAAPALEAPAPWTMLAGAAVSEETFTASAASAPFDLVTLGEGVPAWLSLMGSDADSFTLRATPDAVSVGSWSLPVVLSAAGRTRTLGIPCRVASATGTFVETFENVDSLAQAGFDVGASALHGWALRGKTDAGAGAGAYLVPPPEQLAVAGELSTPWFSVGADAATETRSLFFSYALAFVDPVDAYPTVFIETKGGANPGERPIWQPATAYLGVDGELGRTQVVAPIDWSAGDGDEARIIFRLELSEPSALEFWAIDDLKVVRGGAPVLAALEDQLVILGQQLSLPLSATDPDGDPLTYSLGVDAPSFVVLTATEDGQAVLHVDASALESWGTWPLVVSVSDGVFRDQRAFTLRVAVKDEVQIYAETFAAETLAEAGWTVDPETSENWSTDATYEVAKFSYSPRVLDFNHAILSPAIPLDEAVTETSFLALRWWHRFASWTTSDADPPVTLSVELSRDGGQSWDIVWSHVETAGDIGGLDDYQLESVDLSAALATVGAGDAFALAFRVSGGDSDGISSWRIDDVLVIRGSD